MDSRDAIRLHAPTKGDVSRLLATLNTLHTTAIAGRGAVLAKRVVRLLAADGAAVDVAGPDGAVERVAVTGAGPGDDLLAGGPAASKAAFGRGGFAGSAGVNDPGDAAVSGTVRRFDRSDGGPAVGSAGPASVVRSDYVLDGVASTLVAWREPPFGGRAATLLRLLHPHVAWAIVPAAPGLPPVAGEVLELMLVGLPEKEIARRLNRSRHTIHTHVKRVYRHYAVRSRPELIARHFGREPVGGRS